MKLHCVIMNKHYPLTILCILLIIIPACEKDESSFIIYPDNGLYGKNILKIDALDISSSPDGNNTFDYSMRAELPDGSSLKVIMNKTMSDPLWGYNSSSRIGWSIDESNEYSGSGQLVAYGPVTCDLRIFFFEMGSIEIRIYENEAEEPTRIKNIAWE